MSATMAHLRSLRVASQGMTTAPSAASSRLTRNMRGTQESPVSLLLLLMLAT
jgi:hypothetical protein